MGWLFGWDTRKQLADHLLNDNGLKTIKHCFKGNNIWAVQEYTYPDSHANAGQTVQFIALYLIKGPVFGRGHLRDGWGYKDMDESAGPCHYNCPISYLDMVPDPGGYATEWRAKVREHHAMSSRKFVQGQRIKLYDKEYTVGVARPHGGYTIWDYDHPYRITRSQIKHIEVIQ